MEKQQELHAVRDSLAKEACDQTHGETDDNVNGLTRRGVFRAATLAAVTAGIAAGSARPAYALWPTKPTPRFKSVKPHEGGMFTYTVG